MHPQRSTAAALGLTLGLGLGLSLGLARPAGATELYVYSGGVTANVAFENMIGRKTDGLIWFNDYSHSPEAAIGNLNWSLGAAPKGYKLVVAIPLAFAQPSTDKAHAGAHTLQDIAAGRLDAVYTALGKSLVAHGYAAADIRLGWEEDGNWYPWSAARDWPAFRAAFARASTALRATPGQRFTIWFNPGVGLDPSHDLPAADAFDGVAWDTYASAWSGSYTEPLLWTYALKGWWGIGSEASWPSRTLPYAVPEFGVGSRGDKHGAPDAANVHNAGDDGLFMKNALEYFISHNAKFVGYWDFNAGDYNSKISDGSRPHEALAFLQVEGSGGAPAYLAGATVYTGPIKATIPGMRQLPVSLANGRIAILYWGDTTAKRQVTISLSQPCAIVAVDPVKGARGAAAPAGAQAGAQAGVKASSWSGGYSHGLAALEITP